MKAALAAAAMLAPAASAACPVCAEGDRPGLTLFVLGMIAAPYLVAALVLRVVRSAGGDP